MLNLVQIDRLAEQNAWERLIERVLHNGRGGDLVMRLRLVREEAAAPSALGLAVQRTCELTYGPSAVGTGLVAQLLHLQRDDGFFVSAVDDHSPTASSPRRASPAATAIAVRALNDWREQCCSAGHDVDARVDRAISRGLFALACAQQDDGGFAQDDMESAIVLWQLGRVPAFRQAVRFHDLIDAVSSREDDVPALLEISRLAQAMAA